jgi:hypothetical protein
MGEFGVCELVQQEPLEVLDPVVSAIGSTTQVCDVNIVTSVDGFPLKRNLEGNVGTAEFTVTARQLQREETVKGIVGRFEKLSRCTSKVLQTPPHHCHPEDEAPADQMRMRTESIMEENVRLREGNMWLIQDKDNLHELLDYHRHKADSLEAEDCSYACAVDTVCDDLNDRDISDRVPACSLTQTDPASVQDAYCRVKELQGGPDIGVPILNTTEQRCDVTVGSFASGLSPFLCKSGEMFQDHSLREIIGG